MSRLTVEDDYFLCPNCGAEVKKGKAACAECGSCDGTGWSEAATEAYSDVEWDDEGDFDYDDFVKRLFPESAGPLSSQSWGVTLVILLVCLAMALAVVFSR